eukprot:CAMPEP_0202853074 /NCGR_PEP_ID=MMETSP1389-20130828/90296_1 /ASSEMBLY_ACC=CAM_ASM_000865 /TAXON_ID=302021 /ORGANISM="Rhodomonas sp., Strain CCMP768" /LENGTH=454 /DNA_ID=CAMNT_0049531613 /DNA_START=104 /DNA_END=1468 /DNA_ORIENTATION=+
MLPSSQQGTLLLLWLLQSSFLIAESFCFVTPTVGGFRISTEKLLLNRSPRSPANRVEPRAQDGFNNAISPYHSSKHAKSDEECVWPRILVVSRRHVRKGKYVDFVGEYHIDLLQEFGAAPILVPRTTKTLNQLDAVGEYHIDLLQEFGAAPILVPRTTKTLNQLDAFCAGGVDGVLLMEGSDIGEQFHPFGEGPNVPEETRQMIACKHASDCEIDEAKDNLEMALIRGMVLRDGVPFLGLCRGSQLLNVAMGGSLYCDLALEMKSHVVHMDYDNYDGHRHAVSVLRDTPLATWFPEAFGGGQGDDLSGSLNVNSYHHQGVKELAASLRPMCYAEDGLVEGFYDPEMMAPEEGRFRVGLQWHPERMLGDYQGCRQVYGAFVRAAEAHRRRSRAAEPPMHVIAGTPYQGNRVLLNEKTGTVQRKRGGSGGMGGSKTASAQDQITAETLPACRGLVG